MVVLSTAEQSLLLPKPAVSNDGSASARQHDSTTHAPETSHPAANGQQMTLKALIVATGGTVLEFFDFAVFGYFASVISEEFFPAGNKSAALAETFAVFAGAFCMRPLGGIIFGYLGDRFGHEKALLGSIVMMAVSTFLMGCLPTYRQVGAWAPTFLILVRSLQGLSCGGQLVGGFLVAIENTPAEQSGFFGSVVFASTVVGTAGGSGVAALMRAHMTPAALHSWGWRVPFWCGIFIGLFGYLARGSEMHVSKSADSPSKHKSDKPPKNPLLVAVSESWYDILVIAAACSYTTCSFYLIMVWIVTYLTSMHESNPGTSLGYPCTVPFIRHGLKDQYAAASARLTLVVTLASYLPIVPAAQHSAFTINTISMLGVISLFLPFGESHALR